MPSILIGGEPAAVLHAEVEFDFRIEHFAWSHEPDPSWEACDTMGHPHRWEDGHVTNARWTVEDEQEGWGEWVCALCGESIHPGTRLAAPLNVLLGTWWTFTVRTDQPFGSTVPVVLDDVPRTARAFLHEVVFSPDGGEAYTYVLRVEN